MGVAADKRMHAVGQARSDMAFFNISFPKAFAEKRGPLAKSLPIGLALNGRDARAEAPRAQFSAAQQMRCA